MPSSSPPLRATPKLAPSMWPQRSSLDLNSLPDEHAEAVSSCDRSTSLEENAMIKGLKKKKKRKEEEEEEMDDDGKIYECRFCSLRFSKSQALGGHMNRHRQERETETLNRARQLVFRNDAMATVAPHLGFEGCFQQFPSSVYAQHHLLHSSPPRHLPAAACGDDGRPCNGSCAARPAMNPCPRSFEVPPAPGLLQPPQMGGGGLGLPWDWNI